jgi:hypothetical protein
VTLKSSSNKKKQVLMSVRLNDLGVHGTNGTWHMSTKLEHFRSNSNKTNGFFKFFKVIFKLIFWTFMNFKSYVHVFTGILYEDYPVDVLLGHMVFFLNGPSWSYKKRQIVPGRAPPFCPRAPGGQGAVGRVLRPMKKAIS